jgi:predicted  nucleic acid-binding Zn-ribbon protein
MAEQFKCQECGRRFRTVAAAERAVDKGCPGCGGVDIDVDTDAGEPSARQVSAGRRAAATKAARAIREVPGRFGVFEPK